MARSRHIIPLDKAEASALWNFISGCLLLVRSNRHAVRRLLHLSLGCNPTVGLFALRSPPFYHSSDALFTFPKPLSRLFSARQAHAPARDLRLACAFAALAYPCSSRRSAARILARNRRESGLTCTKKSALDATQFCPSGANPPPGTR